MPIKGLSEAVRLPRLGKIKLGIMVKHKTKKDKDGNPVTYPKEVEFFVCPPSVQETYGEEPKELDIMFPVDDLEIIFPQYYYSYKNDILWCKGDGEKATRWDWDNKEFVEMDCPCDLLEKNKCRAVGRLQFFMPKVKGGATGVFQINTGSKNSIIDINSGIKLIRQLAGRIAMVPIKLIREETDTKKYDSKEGVIKGKHYTLKFALGDVTMAEIVAHRRKTIESYFLPAADESKPEDLFPENGFADEQNGKDLVKPEEPRDLGVEINLSSGESTRMNRKEAIGLFDGIKKQIGEPHYERVLNEFGYKVADQIPDDTFNVVYQALVAKYKEMNPPKEKKQEEKKPKADDSGTPDEGGQLPLK